MSIIPIEYTEMMGIEERPLHINDVFERHGIKITPKENPGENATVWVTYDGNKEESIDPLHEYYAIKRHDKFPRVVIRISAIGPTHLRVAIGKEHRT